MTRIVDCKTVRIFAYSSTREQSNNRFRTRLKTETMRALLAGDAHELRARKTLTPRFTDFFTDFEEKKTSVLQRFAIIAIHPILSKLVRNYMNRKNSLFSVQFTSTLFVFEFPQKRSHRLPITRTFKEIEKSSRYRELEANNRK